MKSSLIRSPGKDAQSPANATIISNDLVKNCLGNKYELGSHGDIIEFAVTEENGIFERGVYKVRTFGQGEIVVKIFRKAKSDAIDYYENIKNTHHAWQQDSSLGQYILKVQLKSKKPDYDETYGLLFLELEKAKETLALKLKRKDQYTEAERLNDFKELVSAVSYLHRRGEGIGRNFHGDLKPDNVFFVDHLNADGSITECLKIGDIEDCLGTLPYRDFRNVSLPAWEKGTLAPTGKEDDLMAIKMIFLELAYDFCLFDFCDELLGKDIHEFAKFLKMNSLERKSLIEKTIGKPKYLKNIFSNQLLLANNIQTLAVISANEGIVDEEINNSSYPADKITGDSDAQRPNGGDKYMSQQCKKYILMCFLGLIFGLIILYFDFGVYLYLTSKTLYNNLDSIAIGGKMQITLYYLGILGFDSIIYLRDAKKQKISNQGFRIDLLIAFLSLVVTIIYFFLLNIYPIERDDYFIKYQEYCSSYNKNIIVPGVKLTNLETAYKIGYTDNFILAVSAKPVQPKEDKELILPGNVFHVPLKYLSEDFFRANREQIIKNFQGSIFNPEPSLDSTFIRYWKSDRYATGADYIRYKRKLNIYTDSNKIFNILLTEFVLTRSEIGNQDGLKWQFFKELYVDINKRQKINNLSMSKLDMIVNKVYNSEGLGGESDEH